MKQQVFCMSSPEAKAHCIGLVGNLNTDGAVEVVIREHQENRRDAQNRLMWHWNREIAQQKKFSSKWAHGVSKLEMLLPLMFEWGAEDPEIMGRAEFIREVMSHIPAYKVKVGVAFDMVRSRDLSVVRFAQYLTEKERHWTEDGVRLTTSEDYYYEAMGLEKPRRAA